MCKKLLSMLLTLALLATALPLGALAQEDAPVNEQVVEQPVTPEEPAAPEGTDEPAGDEAPADPTTPEPPVLTPEELFLAAVALLPTEPVETVNAELLTRLSEVTEQMNALVTQEQLAAITAGEPVEGLSEELLEAVQAVLALTAQVNELNAAAAAAVEALIVALPAADELTLESEAQVTEAATAYAALLSEQQSLITEENVALLDAAQAKLAELIARAKAEKVDELISQLPPAQDININNYTDYQAPAELASNELSVLSDYEREFVSMESKLADVEIAIKANAEAQAVKDMLDALPKTEQAAKESLTFDTTKQNSIDKVFAAEQAYQQLTAEAKGEIATEYRAFKPTYTVAKELYEIRDRGVVIFTPDQRNYVLTVGDSVQKPTIAWDTNTDNAVEFGIDSNLANKYPLTMELVNAQDYIKDENGQWTALKETEEDVIAFVYGQNAAALREIPTQITLTVQPKGDSSEPGATAYVEQATIEFNKAYQYWQSYIDFKPLFNVGGRKTTDIAYKSGTTIKFANQKLDDWFTVSVAQNEDGTLCCSICVRSDKYATIKNGTYKSKLVFTIPGSTGDATTITTNEIKIVVSNKANKIKFQNPTINTVYMNTGAAQDESYYWPTRLTASQNQAISYASLTFVNKDTSSPFIIRYQNQGFYLIVKPGEELKKSSYKATFTVTDPALVNPYDITLTIKAKASKPEGMMLAFSLKNVVLTSRSDFAFTTAVWDNTNTTLLGADVKLLAQKSSKYAYQDCFTIEVDRETSNGSGLNFTLKPNKDRPLPQNKSSFPLLLSVMYPNSKKTLDFPITVTVLKPKVKLLSSSVTLVEPNAGESAVAHVGYKLANKATALLQSYTVNGVAGTDDARAINVVMQSDTGKFVLTPGSTIEYGKKYTVVMTLDNSQKLKLTVKTAKVQNKLKLGKTSISIDLSNTDGRYPTSLTPSYIRNAANSDLLIQVYNATAKEWTSASDLLTAEWTDFSTVTFKPASGLAVGNLKCRIYAPAQGVEAEKGATFTLNVTQGKTKLLFSASDTSADAANHYAIAIHYDPRLSNTTDELWKKNLENFYDENGNYEAPSNWEITIGGEGAKYLIGRTSERHSMPDGNVTDIITIFWNRIGGYELRQHGLKPIKYTVQISDRDTGAVIAQSKTFTIKPKQIAKVQGDNTATLYRQMPYSTDEIKLDAWSYAYYHAQHEHKTWSVSIKNGEKSNYRAYLIGNEDGTNDAKIAIGYKNAEAAKKAKNSETITLVLVLDYSIKPVEYKVKVTNVK